MVNEALRRAVDGELRQSCKLASMTIADDIEALIKRKRRLSLTEEDIADMLFGQNNASQQRVNSACRQLVEERRLVRQGKGGASDPYTYDPPPIKRRKVYQCRKVKRPLRVLPLARASRCPMPATRRFPPAWTMRNTRKSFIVDPGVI